MMDIASKLKQIEGDHITTLHGFNYWVFHYLSNKFHIHCGVQ